MGLRAGWLALFVFVWLIGAILGSTFDYQGGTASGMSYSTGNATFTIGSANVSGNGTTWSNALMAGGVIKFNADNRWYKILSVNSTTLLNLTAVYGQAGGTGAYTMQAVPGWTGNGTGGYAVAPVTKLEFLMNMSNVLQQKPVLGSLSLPMPNTEYFGTAWDVVMWRWSFMTDYPLFYWVFCAPFVIMGVLAIVMIIYQTIFGSLNW